MKVMDMIDHGEREVADQLVDNRVAGVNDRVACVGNRMRDVDNRVKSVDDKIATVNDGDIFYPSL